MPNGSLYFLSASPTWRTTSPRFGAGHVRHSANAACDLATTSSYVLRVTAVTDAIFLPSTGEKESIISPPAFSHLAPVAAPSFIFSMPSLLSTLSIFINCPDFCGAKLMLLVYLLYSLPLYYYIVVCPCQHDLFVLLLRQTSLPCCYIYIPMIRRN